MQSLTAWTREPRGRQACRGPFHASLEGGVGIYNKVLYVSTELRDLNWVFPINHLGAPAEEM